MLYSFIKAIVVVIFKYLCKWQVDGLDNIPKNGPVILISNHVSYWDPVVLAAISSRPVHFMAKIELFKIPIFSSLIKKLGAFPVDRNKSDRAALRDAIGILQNNCVLGMFPEGTRVRTEEIGEFKLGATMIAAKANAVIVPVTLINTRKIFSHGFFRKFKVIVGTPYDFSQHKEEKLTSKQLKKITDDLRNQILNNLAGI